jgi:hypothetical protein
MMVVDIIYDFMMSLQLHDSGANMHASSLAGFCTCTCAVLRKDGVVVTACGCNQPVLKLSAAAVVAWFVIWGVFQDVALSRACILQRRASELQGLVVCADR